MNFIAGLALILPAVWNAGAPVPPTAEKPYTGCVMATEAGDFTFCEPDSCSLLSGKDVGPKLSGHTVTLQGTVQAATAAEPRRVVVSRVVSIGAACDQPCSPRPPGHRGLGHEHPGSEGGTPGATQTPTPQ